MDFGRVEIIKYALNEKFALNGGCYILKSNHVKNVTENIRHAQYIGYQTFDVYRLPDNILAF